MTSNVGRKMGESLKDAGRRPFELARGCFLLWMETFARCTSKRFIPKNEDRRVWKEGYFQKKAKPTHVSAGLNRLYVSVFDYGVTAIIN